MIEVTESAKEELSRRRGVQSLAPGQGLRLATPPVWVGEGDFGIVVDEKKDMDHVVDYNGVEVLLVDSGLADHLSKSVFDFKDSPDGPIFTLDVY